jgi:hypothetical protein
MKIIYHEKFLTPYPTAGVENPDRINSIYAALFPHFEFLTPEPASPDDLLLVHTPRLLQSMTNQPEVYEVALLAAGAAVLTSATALGRGTCLRTSAAAGAPCKPREPLGFLLL